MASGYEFEVYRDRKKQWRWRLKSRRNGKIIADSAEGYMNRAHALRMIGTITRLHFATPVVMEPLK